MSIFSNNTDENEQLIIRLQLNDKCRPIARGELYREPLDEFLTTKKLGEVCGGGTQLQENGESEYCDIEIIIDDKSNFILDELREQIERMEVPKGSYLILNDDNKIPIGSLEGVGVYFRYMEAPEKLFEEIDMDKFWDGIDEAVEPYGKYRDYWEGSEKAAFYYYGADATAIINAVKEKMVGHKFEKYIDPIALSLSIKQI